MAEHGPSEKAVDAGAGELVRGGVAIVRHLGDRSRESDWTPDAASRAILVAAHDPALGLDRSVCLRDVVDWVADQSGVRAARDLIFAFAESSSPDREGET